MLRIQPFNKAQKKSFFLVPIDSFLFFFLRNLHDHLLIDALNWF